MAAVKTKPKTSTKLKAGKKKPLNKWLILGGVAAVAVIGVAVVRLSGASSYVFIRYQSSMNVQDGSKTTVQSGGRTYAVSSTGAVRTIVSKSEATRSSAICAHFKRFSGSGSNRIFIEQFDKNWNLKRQTMAKLPASGQTGNICTTGTYDADSNVRVLIENFDGKAGKVGIDTVYGKR
jgi:hypothetical protein